MVGKPEDFNWSSYKEYTGRDGFSICDQNLIKGLLGEENFFKKYEEFVKEEMNKEELEKIEGFIIESL